MMKKSRSHAWGWLFRLAGLGCVAALALSGFAERRAWAQATEAPWAAPLNLSHTGGTTNPTLLVDSDSNVHVVWQDAFANYLHTPFDATQSSAAPPTAMSLRFRLLGDETTTGQSETPTYTGPNPIFLAGPNGYIFAFWITPGGSLYTSRVPNRNFNNGASWSAGQFVAASAISFVAAVDAQGNVHLAYVRTDNNADNPSGVYATRSRNNGQDWSTPVRLYESPYFRGLSTNEVNLSLAAAGTAEAPFVLLAWDNQPRRQVYLARSADGGASWEQPQLIAGPVPDSDLARPFNIRVGALGNTAMRLWQTGKPGETCAQSFQSSSDAGATWSASQLMLEELQVCAQSNALITDSAARSTGLMYLLTDVQDQTYLSAWNGSQWSVAEVQPMLSEFEEPETYEPVVYGCQRAALSGTQLYVVGCDEGSGRDIWLTSRNVAPKTFSFSPPTWSPPALIIGTDLEVAAVEMVTTDDNLIHAFFSQRQDPAIYYTRWDGARWSRITPVLEVPDGNAGAPAVAAGPENELFLMTRSSSGFLYFSQASSSDAVKTSGWSTSTPISTTHDDRLGLADIAWDAAGTIYIAYSVPVNDERGIYLLQSNDFGRTWSTPLQAFDGTTAGFDFVGSPSLLVSANGGLHLVWKRQSIQADGASPSLSLYYARSEPGGLTFSPAELVVGSSVAWHKIVTDGQGNLHQLWQQSETQTILWDRVSFDGGQSWQPANQLPAAEETAAVALDPAGQLHLASVSPGSLVHWLWDGSRWQSEAAFRWSLPSQSESAVAGLAAAINAQGEMVVVLAEPIGSDGLASNRLLFSTRMLNLSPTGNPTPIPTTVPASPTPKVTPTPAPTKPVPTPTATVESGVASPAGSTDGATASDPVMQYTLALLPAVLLLFAMIGLVILRAVWIRPR